LDKPIEETAQDPMRPARRPAARTVPQLIVALECGRPLAGSARYSLAGVDEVIIGRGAVRGAVRSVEDNVQRLEVTVPDPRMSSSHGRLGPRGNQWVIEDLGSRNGSLLNGHLFERAVIGDGDVLQLGNTTFLLHPSVALPHGAPDDLDSSALASVAPGFPTIVPSLAAAFAALETVARSNVSVLVLGETGTGKEVVARSIHALSGVAGDMVAVNCGAIPDALVESQLFGHMKGAFSGAIQDHRGFVRAADGGTLFLDEIGDLPRASQAALLRVVQEREVTPVGSTRAQRVDVRFVCATHAPLAELAARGVFRSDLLARLGGFTIVLPPLRERREDLGLFVAALLAKVAAERATEIRLSAEVGRAFLTYAWPHNVRELEQCLARAAVLAKSGTIDVEHLPPDISAVAAIAGRAPEAVELSPENDARRSELVAQLQAHEGNIAEVARAMGKARTQIHRWMKRYGLEAERFRK
jgi:transcriptional regulator with AAA-type ATPase domain